MEQREQESQEDNSGKNANDCIILPMVMIIKRDFLRNEAFNRNIQKSRKPRKKGILGERN